MREEPKISSDQKQVNTLINFIDIENVKLGADLINFENAEKIEPTSELEPPLIAQENSESETKPCNVSQRCTVVSIQYINEVLPESIKIPDTVEDTSENRKSKLPAENIVKNPS